MKGPIVTQWTNERTRMLSQPVHTLNDNIEVIVQSMERTPKSITSRVQGKKRYLTANTGNVTVSYLLKVITSPNSEPLQIVFQEILPNAGVKGWLDAQGLGEYFEVVLRTALELQAQLQRSQDKHS